MSDKKTALVISAHSADFVWRAGGAIALHQSKGYEVTVVCLSYGERGESAKLWKQEGMTLEKVKAEDWSFLDGVLEGVFTVPGDGCVDYTGFFRILADHGYDGWVMIEAEQDPKKADPMTYSKAGLAHCMVAAEKAGLALEL